MSFRFNPDDPRATPEALAAASRESFDAANFPGDIHCQRAAAYAGKAERACTRISPERAVAVGRTCRQVREALLRFERMGIKGEAAMLPKPEKRLEPMPVHVPRLPAPVTLSPEEMEEKVEDVSAEILSSGSQLRGGSLRVEARRLLGQAGYRVRS